MHYKQYASDPFWKPILWTGDNGDVPVLHPEGHRLAGYPVQDTSKIVIMTSYLVANTPPTWEPADQSWIEEKPLQDRLYTIVGTKFTDMIPRNQWTNYVASWTQWFATVPFHIDGLAANTSAFQ